MKTRFAFAVGFSLGLGTAAFFFAPIAAKLKTSYPWDENTQRDFNYGWMATGIIVERIRRGEYQGKVMEQIQVDRDLEKMRLWMQREGMTPSS